MRVISLLMLLALVTGGQAAASLMAENASSATEIATGPLGLLDLERQEKVTVRALHGWGRLPSGYLQLARQMRTEAGLDLLGADLPQIREWLARTEPLPAPIRDPLGELAVFMESGDYLDWSPTPADAPLAAGTVARRGGMRWVQPEAVTSASGLDDESRPPVPPSAGESETGVDRGGITAPPQVETASAPAPVFIPDPDFAALPALAVERQRQLAAANITAAGGGAVSSGDGLTVTVPPGAFDRDRQVTIHAARVPPPPLSAGVIGGTAAPLTPLQSWDIDLGPETGLMPEPLEVSVDVSAYPPERHPLLWPAISTDGRTWTRLPAERRGGTLVFQTRHCSPVTLLGLSQAAAVMLPIAAVTYLVYDRVDEFPSRYNEHAPFICLDHHPDGFEIYWSRKVPGADPATGFKDVAGYLQAVDKLLKPHQGKDIDFFTNVHLGYALRKLQRELLMPDCVRRVEKALATARDYLRSRRIKNPLLTLPVYVVPTLAENSGHIHNPWSGRRYMILSAQLDERATNTTALHELFHHYQTGYVWIDRNGHLPLMEASALLMEREAISGYMNAKPPKPFNETEGLALAQFAAFRHGLDGPAQWKEGFVRSFGYGLTWFLEYLRDEHWVKKQNRKADEFHAALLEYWGAHTYGAIHKSLTWAAGGDDASLARALADFAENHVLKGPVDKCGSRSPYGAKYNACPLSDSPYGAAFVAQGLADATVDLSKTPVHAVDDTFIRPWSIQFLKIRGIAGGKAVAAVEIPREWFPAEGRKRSVFVREGATEPIVTAFDDAAPQGSSSAWTTLSLDDDAFVYIVDSGQTGSGWVYDYQPARVVLLQAPNHVESNMENGKLRLKWQVPTAEKLPKQMAYFAYIRENRVGPLKLTGSALAPEAVIAPEDAPSWSGAEAPPVAMVSALAMGQGDDGKTAYLESPRSDIVGGGNAGNYVLELSLDAQDSVNSVCRDLVHTWFYQGFDKRSFPVQVGPDGAFTFSGQWEEGRPGVASNPQYALKGRGTFIDKKVTIEGSFTATHHWTHGQIGGDSESTTDIQNAGTFKGEGEFKHGIWFGYKVSGTWTSSTRHRYCSQSENGKCLDWKTDAADCGGELSAISTIDAFTRTH